MPLVDKSTEHFQIKTTTNTIKQNIENVENIDKKPIFFGRVNATGKIKA